MIRKITQKIDKAIGERKELEGAYSRARKELALKDSQLAELNERASYLEKEAAKVEGLIDESIRQSNLIEELEAGMEGVLNKIGEGLLK